MSQIIKPTVIENAVIRSKNLRLRQVEIDILCFVHEFGFCVIRHIMKRFSLKKSAAYQYVKVLTRLGLLIHERVMQDQPGAYYLTYKAVSFLKLDLSPLRRIPLQVYQHHAAVVYVHLKLRAQYPDAVWVSERRFIKNNYAKKSALNDHWPDGALIISDTVTCAIEVERTFKGKDRLERILSNYGLQGFFKEVWYFCAAEVLPLVQEVAYGMRYVKIYRLEECFV